MKNLLLMRAPLKYIQGANALKHFYENIKEFGNNYLFICSNSAYKSTHDLIEESFKDSKTKRIYQIFGGISSVGEINKMREIVRNEKIDVVVGVGGGSAIDTSKATAYYEKKRIAIIPTVCATDAPCTGLSVIYNDDHTFNSYLFYPNNPDFVLVDSLVIANAPTKFLVAGMGDALGTYFEARECYKTSSLSLENGGITLSSLALCKLCYETLLKCGKEAKISCDNHLVTPELEAIIEANTYLSGVGADNGGLCVAHSFYNGVSSLGKKTAMHGCCVAYGTLVQLVLENNDKEEFNTVREFMHSVGLPLILEEVGITKEDVHKVAVASCADGESIHNFSGDVSVKELEDAILLVDAINKEYLKESVR